MAAWIAGLRVAAAAAMPPSVLVDLSTRTTSFEDVREAVFVHAHGLNAYDGDAFHQAPLLLLVFRALAALPDEATTLLFVLLDVLAALLLRRLCKMYHATLSERERQDVVLSPDVVAAVYLLNPFNVLSCAARSTAVFTNVCVLLAAVFGMQGKRAAATVAVCVAAYLSLYPVMLLLPVCMFAAQQNGAQPMHVVRVLVVAALTLGALLGGSYAALGSWDFVRATYLYILAVPDLTPNVGLFWYFFIEIFEHFRTFFLYVFQLHIFVYALPLTWRFWRSPLVVFAAMCGVWAIFKPYPTVADSALFCALFSCFSHLFRYMRYSFLAGNLIVYASVLGPAFFYLWIYDGSGNANFFYAITLLYGFAHILLVVDLLNAHRRHEFDRDHPELHGVKMAFK